MPPLALAALLGVGFLAALAATGRVRAWRDEFPGTVRWLIAVALLLGVLILTVFYPLVDPNAAAAFDPEHVTFPLLFTGHFLLTGFLLAWWALGWPQPLARFLRLETATPPDLLLGLQVGAVGWIAALGASAVVTLAMTLVLAAGGEPSPAILEAPALLVWLAELPLERKLLVIAVAMTVEEGFYRAFLQPRLGWVLSSVLFAISHAGYGLPNLLASVFVVSLAIGWAFRRTGNLLASIVAHGVFDAIQLLIVMPLAVEHLRGLE